MISETTNLVCTLCINSFYKLDKEMHACALIFLCAGAYAVGAEVLVKDYERKKRKGGKLDYRWLGPYKIERSLGKGLYMLKEANETGRVIDRVHGTRLKPYLRPLSPNVSYCTLILFTTLKCIHCNIRTCI